jgi:2,4-dienoyl-CoA reductase-like NADH-dependent reductase (Old Yellow Enzyme family)
MCQYSAQDGFISDWRLAHYAGIARGGTGLVIVEATGVSPEGRITPGCTGLWNDDQAEGMCRIPAGIKAAGSVPGIQIGHAGRKASANKPGRATTTSPRTTCAAGKPSRPRPSPLAATCPRPGPSFHRLPCRLSRSVPVSSGIDARP